MTIAKLPSVVNTGVNRAGIALITLFSTLLALAPIAAANPAPLSPTSLTEAPQAAGHASDLTVQGLSWQTGLFCANSQTGTLMGSCGGALEPGFAPAATATSNPAMIREAAPIGVVIERNPAVEVDLPRPALAPLFQIEPKRGAVQPMRVDVP